MIRLSRIKCTDSTHNIMGMSPRMTGPFFNGTPTLNCAKGQINSCMFTTARYYKVVFANCVSSRKHVTMNLV